MAPSSPETLLGRLDALDRAVSGRIVARPTPGRRRPWLEVVHRISQTGSYGVGWIALFGVVVTVMEGWAVAALASACVVGMLLLNTVVKQALRRPRPSVNPLGEKPSTFSFPSAHTSMAVVGAAAITVVAPQLAPLWWAWSFVLAGSRIILGMHYVGDVLAGAFLGGVIAAFAVVPIMQSAIG